MKTGPRLTMRRVEFNDEFCSVHVHVDNKSDAPMHVVTRPRGVRVDSAGAIHLRFWDEPLPEGVRAAFFSLPPTRVLEAGEQAEVEFKFPRTFRQATGKLTADGKPEIITIDTSTAPQLILDLAWSDVPFYEDPRKKVRPDPATLFKQSAEWAHGRHSLQVSQKEGKRKP